LESRGAVRCVCPSLCSLAAFIDPVTLYFALVRALLTYANAFLASFLGATSSATIFLIFPGTDFTKLERFPLNFLTAYSSPSIVRLPVRVCAPARSVAARFNGKRVTWDLIVYEFPDKIN
jgi:hypothetical protein